MPLFGQFYEYGWWVETFRDRRKW